VTNQQLGVRTVSEMQLQYNIDITQLSAGLLKVHNAVVKEASRRKDAAGLLEAFRRDSEDSSKEQQNGRCN